MLIKGKNFVVALVLLSAFLPGINFVTAEETVTVVYPDWYKKSLYDLPSDLQDAKENGKSGIMLFFSTSTCSYCKAIIETTFKQEDITQRLRASYDVIGLEVLSDIEVVDTTGKTLYAKDFAVQEKARFTPTIIFYDLHGKRQLHMVGYQSPDKFRAALDYLEGGYYKKMKFGHYLQQNKAAVKSSAKQQIDLNLMRGKKNTKPLLLVFETSECKKCQLLRAMLDNPAMQPYKNDFDITFINQSDIQAKIITPDGSKQNVKAWVKSLALLHSPAMVFYNEQGNEVLRVDTDILIDQYGNNISADNSNVLGNLRARLQFVSEKGYIDFPQFQRWRAQKSKKIM